MKARVRDKIREIESYLRDLRRIKPRGLKGYLEIKNKAACERYFEKIVEAVIDLAYLLMKELNIEAPDDDKNAFDKMVERGVIQGQLAGRLKDAKGMRNIIAHEYGKVDDEIVYNSIGELDRDVREFLKAVKKQHL